MARLHPQEFRLTTAGAVLALAITAIFSSAHAQTLTTLHSFTGTPDGAFPAQANLLDVKGTLYGTTGSGGVYGYGTIFKITSSGKESVLYSFTGGADGAAPSSGLVRDKGGNLYGTTFNGGDLNCFVFNYPGCGVAYEFGTTGHLTVLHAFTGGADGANPQGLSLDSAGNFYGPAFFGGDLNCPLLPGIGCGVVFKLTRQGSSWNETALYTFQGGADGGIPNGFLSIYGGNIYGATASGGNLADCTGPGCGVIFKIAPSGQETVLYAFTGSTDGDAANGALLMDAKGNLYGTAEGGGNLNCSEYIYLTGCGVVFQITPAGKENVIHTFEGSPADGANPTYGLVADSKGNGYSTTQYGGTSNFGTVFKINSRGIENLLHSFTGGTDGGYADSGLIFDSSGNLYSNTYQGGDLSCNPPLGCGTVFKLTP
jgi:uncharacterized repeat protein (TIGR03803 family)